MAEQTSGEHPDFPTAVGGDVHISLGNARKYTLHSSLLRRSSSFFAGKLTDDNTTVPEKAKKDGVRVVRWRFELRDQPYDDEHGCGVLVLLDLDSKGMIKPTLETAHRPSSGINGIAAGPQPVVYDYYHRVLGALHSLPLPIDECDLGTLLREVLGLASVAEYLGCMDVVNGHLNLALLNQNQELYRAIAHNPSAWVGLGIRIRSEVVFREAVIHLVGRWNSIPGQQKYDEHFLQPQVREFCQSKHDEIQATKARIEHQIVKYYPSALTRDPEVPDSFNRQSYSNDVFGWIAITLFKHWFAAALASDKGRHADDGGFWLYNTISQGKDAYLSGNEVNGFHHRIPMSVKGKVVFEKWLADIKKEVRVMVAPLLVSHSSLDGKGEDDVVEYLTCVKVGKEDLPWIRGSSGIRTKSGAARSGAGRRNEPTDAVAGYDGMTDDQYDSEDIYDG